MLKFAAFYRPSTVALPVSISWARNPANTVFVVRLLVWMFQWVYIDMPKLAEDVIAEDELLSRKLRRGSFRATKAYADGRQKAPRNRKRKPSKAMSNVYNLN